MRGVAKVDLISVRLDPFRTQPASDEAANAGRHQGDKSNPDGRADAKSL